MSLFTFYIPCHYHAQCKHFVLTSSTWFICLYIWRFYLRVLQFIVRRVLFLAWPHLGFFYSAHETIHTINSKIVYNKQQYIKKWVIMFFFHILSPSVYLFVCWRLLLIVSLSPSVCLALIFSSTCLYWSEYRSSYSAPVSLIAINGCIFNCF